MAGLPHALEWIGKDQLGYSLMYDVVWKRYHYSGEDAMPKLQEGKGNIDVETCRILVAIALFMNVLFYQVCGPISRLLGLATYHVYLCNKYCDWHHKS